MELLSAVNVKAFDLRLISRRSQGTPSSFLYAFHSPRTFPLRFSYIITHKSFLHAKHIFCYFVPSAFYENLINLIKIPGALSTSHTHPNTQTHQYIDLTRHNYSPHSLKGLCQQQQQQQKQLEKRTRTTVEHHRHRHQLSVVALSDDVKVILNNMREKFIFKLTTGEYS